MKILVKKLPVGEVVDIPEGYKLFRCASNEEGEYAAVFTIPDEDNDKALHLNSF
jgi:hypothetical protein